MAHTIIAILCSLVYFSLSVIANPESLNDILFNGDYEFFDLTHFFDNNTIYWPQMQNFTFTKHSEVFFKNGSRYASNDFAAGEHGGTHIDAPFHFNASGKHVGELPLDNFIVPLIIVDISSTVKDDPNFILYKHHLDHLLIDNCERACVIIFKFGWAKFFSDRRKYLGIDEKNNTLSFPGLSGEVAEWITSYKNVVGIGVDAASVDPGSSKDYPVHILTSAAGLFIIENVKLDESLPEYGCTALIFPMKIASGTGAPSRFVAVCPKNKPTDL